MSKELKYIQTIEGLLIQETDIPGYIKIGLPKLDENGDVVEIEIQLRLIEAVINVLSDKLDFVDKLYRVDIDNIEVIEGAKETNE